jgi:cobalt/nickel transport system ATP-binding protein
MQKCPIIKCENLKFTYPNGNKVLKEINLNVSEGEKVALIGPNGTGKSTLLLQFNGILSGSGKIRICEMNLNRDNLTLIRRKVGVVFQDPNDQLFCPTVFDDVAFGPLHFGTPKDEIKSLVAKTLADIGLQGFEEKSGHHLSLGERKRVAIATVLACRPDIILLDEPTANLDPKHRRDMINMINNWSYTTIIATHDLDLAWDTCPRCIILNSGVIKEDNKTAKILKNKQLLKSNDLELPLRFQ